MMSKILNNILFYGVISFSWFCLQEFTNSKPLLTQSPALENFIDIIGIYGEKEIQQLTQLGVIEATSNQFQPSTAITRGEFITWLVKTYNELHENPIHLPENSASVFPDVAVSHPHFIYIQLPLI